MAEPRINFWPCDSPPVKLVLLPGMDGTGTLFAGLVDALGEAVKTQIVGYPTDRCLSYQQLTDIARCALPSDGPFVLLGESFSGPVAIALAAEQPERLKGLVLCCSFATNPRPWLAAPAKRILQWPVPLPPMPILSAALLGRFSTPALRKVLKTAVDSVQAEVLRSRLAQVMAVDASSQLREVQVPVLYLQASQDRLVPTAVAHHIQGLCPNTQLKCLPGPHMLLQSLPRECAALIQQFLGELDHAN